MIRRQLLKTAETQLTSYAFKWMKNGDIFVRKDKHSYSIKITNEAVLKNLIADQAANEVATPPANVIQEIHPSLPVLEGAVALPPPLSDYVPLPSATPLPLNLQRFPHTGSLTPLPKPHTPITPRSYVNVANNETSSLAPIRPVGYQSRTNFYNRNSLLSPSEMLSFNRPSFSYRQRFSNSGHINSRSSPR